MVCDTIADSYDFAYANDPIYNMSEAVNVAVAAGGNVCVYYVITWCW